MGTSVELQVGDYVQIREGLIEQGVPDDIFIDKILSKFGEAVGDRYFLLNNEFYEDFNSFYGVSDFIDKLYNVDSFPVFLRQMSEASGCNRNIYDVADELGIELPEEDGMR